MAYFEQLFAIPDVRWGRYSLSSRICSLEGRLAYKSPFFRTPASEWVMQRMYCEAYWQILPVKGIPWRRKWQLISFWEIPWTEEPGGLLSKESQSRTWPSNSTIAMIEGITNIHHRSLYQDPEKMIRTQRFLFSESFFFLSLFLLFLASWFS